MKTDDSSTRFSLRRPQDGAVLVVVLLAMIGLLGMGLAGLYLTSGNIQMNSNINMRNQALYVAEGGIQVAKGILNRSNSSLSYPDLSDMLSGTTGPSGAVVATPTGFTDEIPGRAGTDANDPGCSGKSSNGVSTRGAYLRDDNPPPAGFGCQTSASTTPQPVYIGCNYPPTYSYTDSNGNSISYNATPPDPNGMSATPTQYMGQYTLFIRQDLGECRQGHTTLDSNGIVVIRSEGTASDNRTKVVLEVTMSTNPNTAILSQAIATVCPAGAAGCDDNASVQQGITVGPFGAGGAPGSGGSGGTGGTSAGCTSDSNCASGTICCNGACVDKTTAQNCGTCGNQCSGSTPACCNGVCAVATSVGTLDRSCGPCGGIDCTTTGKRCCGSGTNYACCTGTCCNNTCCAGTCCNNACCTGTCCNNTCCAGTCCNNACCAGTCTGGVCCPANSTCNNIAVIGEYGIWQANGQFNQWLATHSSTCNRVDTLTIESDPNSSNNWTAKLSNYGILIVLDVFHTAADIASFHSTGNYWTYGNSGSQRAFTDTEVNNVKAWVRSGRGLMTVVGTAGCANEVVNPNKLLAKFNLGYSSDHAPEWFLRGISPSSNCWIRNGNSKCPWEWITTAPLSMANVPNLQVDSGFPLLALGAGPVVLARPLSGSYFYTWGNVGMVVDSGSSSPSASGRVVAWADEWLTYNNDWTATSECPAIADSSTPYWKSSLNSCTQRFWNNIVTWLRANCSSP